MMTMLAVVLSRAVSSARPSSNADGDAREMSALRRTHQDLRQSMRAHVADARTNARVRRCLQIRGLCDETVTRGGAYVNLILVMMGVGLVFGRELTHSWNAAFSVMMVAGGFTAMLGLGLFIPYDAFFLRILNRWTLKAESYLCALNHCEDRIRSLKNAPASPIAPASASASVSAPAPSSETRKKRNAKSVPIPDRSVTADAVAAAAAPEDAMWTAQESQYFFTEYAENRIQQFLGSEWCWMRGADFEEFLAKVFQYHGYDVKPTGKTGDQGVDLILTRNQLKIAIQAKGYPKSTVGNKAVQEIYAGVTHYKCDKGVVITNSRFTRGARTLAQSTNSILVDKWKMRDLIKGRLCLDAL